jgi:hypothetical protein
MGFGEYHVAEAVNDHILNLVLFPLLVVEKASRLCNRRFKKEPRLKVALVLNFLEYFQVFPDHLLLHI